LHLLFTKHKRRTKKKTKAALARHLRVG